MNATLNNMTNSFTPVQRMLLRSMTVDEAGLRGLMRAEQVWINQKIVQCLLTEYEPLLHVACKKGTPNTSREVMLFSLAGGNQASLLRQCGRECAERRVMPEAILYSAESWLDNDGREGVALYAHNFGGTVQAHSIMEIVRAKAGVIIVSPWGDIRIGGAEGLKPFWDGYASVS